MRLALVFFASSKTTLPEVLEKFGAERYRLGRLVHCTCSARRTGWARWATHSQHHPVKKNEQTAVEKRIAWNEYRSGQ